MKNTLVLLLLFITINATAQTADATNQFTIARKIIGDLDSIVSPNGVQESFETTIGGIKQWIYVRGQDKRNPIILFIHGGPASPISPVMWMFQRPFEEYFTV